MADRGRVVIHTAHNEPFEIREYDLPDPEPGAIILKITQAGICGSDLHTWRGDQINIPVPPGGRVMGHEGTGVIHKMGAGVTTDSNGDPIKEGDRLMHVHVFPCYHCHMCIRGDTNWCVNREYPEGDVWPYFTGTYGDYIYLPPRHPAFRVPDELSDDILGFVNCAMGTVTQGLIRARAHEGDQVVIMGAGGLGLNAVAMARDMGADRIIVLDRLENRLQLAEDFGADETVNIEEYNTPETRVQRVFELTRGRGADIVMELVGRPDLIVEGIDMLSNGGTFVEIGDIIPGPTAAIDPSKLLRGKNIVGSLMYRPSTLAAILDYMVKNRDKIPFHKIVSHKFLLADINEAFPQAEWNQRQTDISRAMLVP